MNTRHHPISRVVSPVVRVLTAVVLLGFLAACDGDGDASSQQETASTGGIFGGTRSPSADRGSSSEGTPSGSGDAASNRAEGGTSGRAAPAGPGRTERLDISSLGHDEGSADAPIRVVEFSDFGCGYCRKFHVETYPTIHEEYVETGKVVWKYVPFVLGIFPNGLEAARAGECAIAQGDFPDYRDRLFEDQDAWKEADEPLDVFVRLAREEGLDGDRLRTCYEERRHEDRIQRNIEVGRRVGIRGTPMFLVEGQPVQGAQPLDVFRQIFDRLLEEQGAAGPSAQGGQE